MAKVKYQTKGFSLFEYRNVEEHLSKMAAKGWRLEKIGPYFWKYRKSEPKQVAYAVTYVPEASEYNPGPTPEQVTLEEFCEAAGWEKVVDWAQAQIYCNENPNPIPLETEDSVRLDVITKSMKKNFVPIHFLMLALFAMMLMTSLNDVGKFPMLYLAQGLKLFMIAISVLGILLVAATLGNYFLWVKRSERSIADGGGCVETNITIINRLFSGLLVVMVLGLFFRLVKDDIYTAVIWIVYMVIYFAVILGIRQIQQLIKKIGLSRETNIGITLLLAVIFGFVLTFGRLFADRHGLLDFAEEEPVETITYRGNEWDVYHDPMPLKVEDLMETDYEYYTYRSGSASSFILSRLDANQRHAIPDTEEAFEIDYEIIELRFPSMLEWTLEQYLEDDDRKNSGTGYHTSDHNPWGADSAWRWYVDGEKMNIYVFTDGESRVVKFWSSWELTQEQKSVIGDTLLHADLSV